MKFETRCEKCRDGDLGEVTAFAKGVFGVDFETFLPFIYEKGAPTGHNHFVVRENGEIAAAVLNYPQKLFVRGEEILSYGVGTVCVREESRGRGYMADMLGSCLTEASEEGAAFLLLAGQRQRYGYYGFALADTHTSFRLSESSITHSFGKGPSKYTIRDAVPSDGQTLLEIMKTAPVYPERSAEKFTVVTRHDYRLTRLVLEGDRPVGYFVQDGDGDWITELGLLPGASVGDFLLAVFGILGHGFHVAVNAGDTDVCRALFTNGSGWSRGSDLSVAVIDWPKMINTYARLFEGTKKIPDGKFVFGVEPHPFFEMIGVAKKGLTDGTFEISAKDGVVAAKATEEKAEITLPYLRAVEYLFTDGSMWYPETPAWAHALLPIPFYYPSADEV